MNPLGDPLKGKTGGTQGAWWLTLFMIAVGFIAIWFGDEDAHGRMAWKVFEVLPVPVLALLASVYGLKRWVREGLPKNVPQEMSK